MIRTLHSARRSLRAALRAGRHVVSAAVSAHHRLDPTRAGDITVRAYDWRDRDEASFRTDRMTIAA